MSARPQRVGQVQRSLVLDKRSIAPRANVRLSVAVMAHPSRAAQVEALMARMDRPAEVVWDRINDRWDTGRRSQLAYNPNATHHLVVQDDAVIPRDFVAGVEHAVAHAPEGVALCLYLGAVRPFAARISRAVERAGDEVAWLVMRDLHWGVGVVLPTEIIEQLITDQDRRTSIVEYDRRMSRWLTTHNVQVWYPWPSLVDHRDEPSLVGHGSGRHAHRFIGESVSALEVDWTRPALHVPNPRQANAIQWPRRGGR